MPVLERTIRVKATKSQVLAALKKIPQAARGEALGRTFVGRQLAQKLLVRTALALQEKIHEEFLVKSSGGTDDAGLRWAPLAPATVAAKRRKHPRRRKGPRPTDILRETDELAKSLKPGAQADEAPSIPPTVQKQVFRLGKAQVTIGTSRPWAQTHHKGIPGRLPRRPLWPAPRAWPTSWWTPVLHQTLQGVVEIIAYAMERTSK